ncbi:MAG: NADH-quinone oxidoreductase subunit M, partial [Psychrobacter sp.]
GTGNFIGEFMILFGSFAQYPVFVVLATFSLVLAGLYSLILIHRALFGKNNIKEVAIQETKSHGLPPRKLKDLGKRELSLLLILAAGLVWLGLYPQPFLDTSSHAMQWINNAYVYSQVTQVDAAHLLDAMEAR